MSAFFSVSSELPAEDGNLSKNQRLRDFLKQLNIKVVNQTEQTVLLPGPLLSLQRRNITYSFNVFHRFSTEIFASVGPVLWPSLEPPSLVVLHPSSNS